jgi:ADP-ribosylglycohydrolase
MVSDDTEHTWMVGQALLASPRDPDAFGRSLAWRLRLWLLSSPAGVGLATLRAIVKLWLGFSHRRSGVYSAGNGPAMRAALLGVCLGEDLERLRAYVRACTRITHTDPRAERGAMLVALAAWHGATQGPKAIGVATVEVLAEALSERDAELTEVFVKIQAHLERNDRAAGFAEALCQGDGISGYVYHSVPVGLYCWLRSPGDYSRALEEAILLGGDTDTTGAIVGRSFIIEPASNSM